MTRAQIVDDIWRCSCEIDTVDQKNRLKRVKSKIPVAVTCKAARQRLVDKHTDAIIKDLEQSKCLSQPHHVAN